MIQITDYNESKGQLIFDVLNGNFPVTITVDGTDGLAVPVGTTLQRPEPSGLPLLRYNTDISVFEMYDITLDLWVTMTTTSDMTIDINTLSGDLISLESDVGTLSGDIITLESDVGTLSGDLISLESDVGTLSGGMNVRTIITVDTVADMKAFNPNVCNHLYVRGYNAKSVTLNEWRGGGYFDYDPTSTSTVENGKVFATSIGTGRWIRTNVNYDFANVDMYGAIRSSWEGAQPALSVAQNNDDAFARCITYNRHIEFSADTYYISVPIYVRDLRTLQGYGADRASRSHIKAHSTFSGDAMVQDYVQGTFPNLSAINGHWNIQRMTIDANYTADVCIIATTWNENCGVRNMNIWFPKRIGIWLRANAGLLQNWDLSHIEIFPGGGEPFVGILVGTSISRCEIRNVTILTYNNVYRSPQDCLDSIPYLKPGPNFWAEVGMPTLGTYGIIVGAGTEIALNNIHIEWANVGIVLKGFLQAYIENSNNNPQSGSKALLAIGADVQKVTVISSMLLTSYNAPSVIYNEHPNSTINSMQISEWSDGQVSQYHWNREDKMEMVDYKQVISGRSYSISDVLKTATKTTSTSYVIGTTDLREAYGGSIYVTGNATVTAPIVDSGMTFTVTVLGPYTVSVDVNSVDLMWLDGVRLDDGDKATSNGTSGATIKFTYLDASGWVAESDGWIDGGQ